MKLSEIVIKTSDVQLAAGAISSIFEIEASVLESGFAFEGSMSKLVFVETEEDCEYTTGITLNFEVDEPKEGFVSKIDFLFYRDVKFSHFFKSKSLNDDSLQLIDVDGNSYSFYFSK